MLGRGTSSDRPPVQGKSAIGDNLSRRGLPWPGRGWFGGAGILGNWEQFDDDGTTQSRAHDAANKITDLSDTASDPNYDSRGNMTADANLLYKYDAWNRLAEVRRRADNSLTATYRHDLPTCLTAVGQAGGTNPASLDGKLRRASRRIRKFLPMEGGDANVTYDYYYDFSWRLVEVRKNGSGSPYEQYVWSPRYTRLRPFRPNASEVLAGQGCLAGASSENPEGFGGQVDAAVLRDRDVGSLERVYYLTDAQMNVTALTDPNGQVVERYLYDAYGQAGRGTRN